MDTIVRDKKQVGIQSGLRALGTLTAFTAAQPVLASLLHGIWLQIASALVAAAAKGLSAYLSAKSIELQTQSDAARKEMRL